MVVQRATTDDWRLSGVFSQDLLVTNMSLIYQPYRIGESTWFVQQLHYRSRVGTALTIYASFYCKMFPLFHTALRYSTNFQYLV
jgi:hypothetical protein